MTRNLTILLVSVLIWTGPGAAAEKEKLREAGDGEWISLSGTVKSTAGDGFTLRYGRYGITIEIDDPARYGQIDIRPGDKVNVSGTMDKNFLRNRSIEASSIHVRNRDEYYYSSAVDEEGDSRPQQVPSPVRGEDRIGITGTVIEIDESEREFSLDIGEHTLLIGALDLSRNLFDAGHPDAIAVGDRVTVYGSMAESDLFGRRELTASSVVQAPPRAN